MRVNCECKRCGWKWISRITGGPKTCPGCKSTGWRTESKGRGNWVPEVEDKIKMECSICKQPFNDGQAVYRFQEMRYKDGTLLLKSREVQGVYCENCSPPEDVLPFAD